MSITSAQQLSNVLQDQRKRQKKSQTAVAQNTGLRQDTISKFENSPNGTRLDTLFRLLAALNLELEVKPRGSQSSTTAQWSEEW